MIVTLARDPEKFALVAGVAVGVHGTMNHHCWNAFAVSLSDFPDVIRIGCFREALIANHRVITISSIGIVVEINLRGITLSANVGQLLDSRS